MANIKIGEIIKKLRKERDVTQEKLAEYLGISYQAVSKWENGTALPDITLVVPLANFFGVSTDELFSLNEQITNDKINEYHEKRLKFFNLGDMQACIDLMREALAEYPRNFEFMLHLARAIQWKSYNKGFGIDREAKNKEFEEVIQLCERVLEDCTDSNTRNGTMQILCTAYKDSEQKEKAIKLAEDMPYFSATRDWLLSSLYDGDKRIDQKQDNILFCVYFAAHELIELSHELDFDLRVAHLQAALKLYETIFYDGNALYYHTQILRIYSELANCYIQEDTGKAMEYLLLVEKHAIAADAIPEESAYYTSVFVNKKSHSTANTIRSHTETWCEQFFERLSDRYFEPLFDNAEFAALKGRLANR